MHAENVDLVDVPPLVGVDRPRWPRLMTLTDARVRDQQVELARLGDRPLDRAAIRDVDLHRLAGDLTRDRLDLRAAARAHDNIPAVARERPRDARSNAATATRNERSHSDAPYRHATIGVRDEELDEPYGPLLARQKRPRTCRLLLRPGQARPRSRRRTRGPRPDNLASAPEPVWVEQVLARHPPSATSRWSGASPRA